MATARCTVSDAAIGGAAGAVAAVGGAATGDDYGQSYTAKLLALGPIAYWPLGEAGGTDILDISGNAYNGTYSGVTLGQEGIEGGCFCPLWDGLNDYGDIYSAGFAGAFSGVAGTLALWAKVSAEGVWTDSSTRYMALLRADADNRVLIAKTSTNNQVQLMYAAGGTQSKGNHTTSTTAWQHYAITWSISADEVKMYLAGSQSGPTLNGLGTWAGNLASTTTLIGAASKTPTFVWSGYLAHVAVWTSALTPAQIATLAVV